MKLLFTVHLDRFRWWNFPWKNTGTCWDCPGTQAIFAKKNIIHFLGGGWTTHLKNMSQNGNLPEVGVNIKNIWNHHIVLAPMLNFRFFSLKKSPWGCIQYPTHFLGGFLYININLQLQYPCDWHLWNLTTRGKLWHSSLRNHIPVENSCHQPILTISPKGLDFCPGFPPKSNTYPPWN